MKIIKVTAEIIVPIPPDFFQYQGGKISIADISSDDLIKISEAWKEELLLKAERIRAYKCTQQKVAAASERE